METTEKTVETMTEKTVENPVETVEKIDYELLYKQSADTIKELTAERDSLKTENDELRTAKEQAIADSAKTRELNYTLSRQLNIDQNVVREPEEILADIFLNKERG